MAATGVGSKHSSGTEAIREGSIGSIPSVELHSSSHVLIAGVSTRAVAESAARAGFVTTAIDAFEDLDQHPLVRALSPRGGFSPLRAARAARAITCDGVVYLAGFENHPVEVAMLAENRALWGNAPAVLARVRDPLVLAQAFRDRGHPVPMVRTWLDNSFPSGLGANRRWLLKALAAGGGRGVRPWDTSLGLPSSCYLQERVDGVAGSVVFVAAARRAVPIGVSRQLIGERAFGAQGYQYCGSILEASSGLDAALVERATGLASVAAEEFGLIGVNGIDFVARGPVPYPVELNPRWCASMELVERAYGVSVFRAHVAACTTGSLPEFDLGTASDLFEGAIGKAVVFARRDVTLGDTRPWLAESLEAGPGASIRDIPRPGERIRAGRPVCTVLVSGRDGVRCRERLVQCAARVYAALAVWEMRPRTNPVP